MSYYDEEENCWYSTWWEDGHYIKQRSPFEGHYANKNEAKELRKIMSQTGLTEKEVRGIKKYRIQLSEAQKVQKKRTGSEKRARLLLKSVCQVLKLPKEHPIVIREYNKVVDHNKNRANYMSAHNYRYYLSLIERGFIKEGHLT